MSDFGKLLGIENIESLREKAKNQRRFNGKGCVLCDYTGYTYNDDKTSSMCSCLKDNFFKDLFVKANVPRAYMNKSIDDWNVRTDSSGNDLGPEQTISERVFLLLKNYEKNLKNIFYGSPPIIVHSGNRRTPLHSIIFEGNIGSGKTFIASVLVQSCIRKGFSAKYYDWSDLNSLFSDFEKKKEFDEVVEDFKTLDLIALDGVEMYTYMHPQSASLIDRLSKARINSGKPIIVFSLGNIFQISGGSGWASLLNKCLTIRLPQAIK